MVLVFIACRDGTPATSQQAPAKSRTPVTASTNKAAAQPTAPNIVLIVVDALRADRLGAKRNNVPVTPRLERLAKQSVWFTRAVSPCSWTKPAMASILTSRYVDAHRVFYAADGQDDAITTDVLPDTLPSAATYLKNAGYTTACVQTNGNLSADLGFDQGFDRFVFENNADADWTTDRAIEHLQALTPPFFLYVHYMDPHAPYSPPEPYRSMFGTLAPLTLAEQKAVANSLDYLVDQAYAFLGLRDKRHFDELSPQGRETLRVFYDAECRFMDTELARLLDVIWSTTERTLVVATGDHGEEFWEHGSMGHGQTMYHEQIAVPLLFHGPGLEPRTIAFPVETLHILPTAAAYAGLDADPFWQGHDLFAPEALAPPAVFSNTYATLPRTGIHAEMVLEDTVKLIVNHIEGEDELYNLAVDPLEQDNLAPSRPETVNRLRNLLDEHRKNNIRHGASGAPRITPDLPESLLEQLRALGYLPSNAASPDKNPLDPETRERLKSLGYLH